MGNAGGAYDLEKIKSEWTGKETERLYGKYPVEYEPIRRHCQMVDNNNPLFLDKEYAEKTKRGSVICPPVAIPIFSIPGRLPPNPKPRIPVLDMGLPLIGSGFTNMGRELEFIQPVKVGDQLSSRTRIANLFQKSTRLDPESLWIVSEDIVTNQKDEVVCIVRNTLLNYRTAEEMPQA